MAGTPPDRLSRGIEAALRVGGLAIALVQGLIVPFTLGPNAISPPLLLIATGMMGVAQAVRRDRERGRDS